MGLPSTAPTRRTYQKCRPYWQIDRRCSDITFAASRATSILDQSTSLIREGFDFGFGSFFPGGLLGALPVGARDVVGGILEQVRGGVSPLVIGEIPRSALPPVPTGPSAPTVPSGPITVPEGWETVVIGGEERIVVPDVYGGATQDTIPAPISEEVLRTPVPVPVDDLDEESGVSDDWGHLIRQGIGALTGINEPAAAAGGFTQIPGAGNVLTGPLEPGAPAGGAMSVCVTPRYLTYDTKTGKFNIRRRRRRRALCTDKDLACLAQIVAIVGKGQGGNIAVSKALR